MNGISEKNSEKAVAKVLRELGITDRVKAKEILSKAAAEEAANSENNGTGEEMLQIQQALAKERERADGAVLESLLLAAHVDAKKVTKAARLVERDKCLRQRIRMSVFIALLTIINLKGFGLRRRNMLRR